MKTATIKILGVTFSLDLVRHDMADQPQTPADHVAYVQLDHTDRLFMGFWKNGAWLDHRSRPFPHDPVAWYSLEPRRG